MFLVLFAKLLDITLLRSLFKFSPFTLTDVLDSKFFVVFE